MSPPMPDFGMFVSIVAQARRPGATLSNMAQDRAPSKSEIAAWILTAIALVLVLLVHLLPALFAGLLVYELVHLAAPALSRHLSNYRAKVVVVALLATAVVGVVAAGTLALTVFLQSDPDRPAALLAQFADVVLRTKATVPAWAADFFPGSPEEFNTTLANWVRAHVGDLELAGRETGRALVYALLGMIVGAIIALQGELRTLPMGPLARALVARAANLSSAFRRVVFAQVRISLLNTLFTGIYLVLLLPLFDANLPLRKTLIVLTFVVGLVPVLGNLVSNTFIVIVSLSHSGEVAVASLVFLIVIHKLEYFLNARIIGRQIQARAWELLVAIVAMEAAFGIAGVVAAPIYYAFLKDELTARGLV
jgi:predicted PurR-regulated permease PerM